MAPTFEKVFRGLGCSPAVAKRCAEKVGPTYLDRRSWKVFPDVFETLGTLESQGWTHWILSNHVPELEDIVEDLGLMAWISKVITSGLTGFEKPNPRAYSVAIDQASKYEAVWMIGDSFTCDYEGPRKVGIPSVLVRKPESGATPFAEILLDVIPILASPSGAGV